MKVTNVSVGDEFTGLLQIRDVSSGETRTGSPYMFVKAGDITGDILVKIWSINDELAKTLNNKSIGNFIKVESLEVGEYRGDLELASQGGKGISYLSRENIDKDPTFDITDYSVGSPLSREEMVNSILHDMRYEISNMEVKRLVATIFDKYRDDFENYPAAIRVHHEYENGLLFHTYNMLEVGKSIASHYPFINKSLLLGGIILHDMGKVLEYEKSKKTGGFEYSKEGNLLGHISIMSSEIRKVGEDISISDEVIVNLQHIVLSHHGKLEWGSPVVPKTPEAILVHHIDNMDAKMEQIRSGIIGHDKGEETGRIYGLGNIPIYIPDLDD